jgi:glycosyltransferase involved in cell wall biosynthesis
MTTLVHWDIGRDYGLWAFRPPHVPDCLEFVSKAVLGTSLPALTRVPKDRLKVLMNGLAMDEYLARGGNGTDLRTAWGVDDDTVVVGTASAIRPRKTLEDFIHLIRRLLDRGLKVRGVIAGGGRFADTDYLAELHELVRQQRLEKDCLMIGNLDPITPFMKAIDLFVSTSKWETFGMSVCEAMVCGKPAIAYDAGSLAEVVPESWCIVPFGALDALEERAIRLVTDATFRRELGRQGEHFVRQHFDGPVLAARQQAIYEAILKRPLQPRTKA